jgi:hypothetical protein
MYTDVQPLCFLVSNLLQRHCFKIKLVSEHFCHFLQQLFTVQGTFI